MPDLSGGAAIRLEDYHLATWSVLSTDKANHGLSWPVISHHHPRFVKLTIPHRRIASGDPDQGRCNADPYLHLVQPADTQKTFDSILIPR